MNYEWLFQAKEAGGAYDPDSVTGVLVARGATVQGDGALLWKVRGEVLDVRMLREGGRRVAMELRLPLSLGPEQLKAVLGDALEVAAEAQCGLFDPQLMRPLTVADAEAVASQYEKTARYAGEMVGTPEALGGAGYATPSNYGASTGGMSGQAKLLLVIAAFVALYLLVSGLSGALGGGAE